MNAAGLANALFIILNTYRNASPLLLFIKTYANPAHRLRLSANAKISDTSEYSESLFCPTALAEVTNHRLIRTFIAHIHCVFCGHIPGTNVGFVMDSVTNASSTSSSVKSCVYPSLLRL